MPHLSQTAILRPAALIGSPLPSAVGAIIRFANGSALGALILLTACSTPTANEAFCELASQNSGRVDATDVGSDEHVSALDEMADAAPEEIADDIATVRNHIRNEVSADNPDSRVIANYPDAVQQAIRDSEAFIADACGVEMGP